MIAPMSQISVLYLKLRNSFGRRNSFPLWEAINSFGKNNAFLSRSAWNSFWRRNCPALWQIRNPLYLHSLKSQMKVEIYRWLRQLVNKIDDCKNVHARVVRNMILLLNSPRLCEVRVNACFTIGRFILWK